MGHIAEATWKTAEEGAGPGWVLGRKEHHLITECFVRESSLCFMRVPEMNGLPPKSGEQFLFINLNGNVEGKRKDRIVTIVFYNYLRALVYFFLNFISILS